MERCLVCRSWQGIVLLSALVCGTPWGCASTPRAGAGVDRPSSTAERGSVLAARAGDALSHAGASRSDGPERVDPKPGHQVPPELVGPGAGSGRQTRPPVDYRQAALANLVQQASSKYLIAADLVGKTDWELTLMRNGPYARHGYRFHDADIRDYFACQSWYHPSIGDMDRVSQMLTAIERHNTALIRDYQQTQRRLGRLRPEHPGKTGC